MFILTGAMEQARKLTPTPATKVASRLRSFESKLSPPQVTRNLSDNQKSIIDEFLSKFGSIEKIDWKMVIYDDRHNIMWEPLILGCRLASPDVSKELMEILFSALPTDTAGYASAFAARVKNIVSLFSAEVDSHYFRTNRTLLYAPGFGKLYEALCHLDLINSSQWPLESLFYESIETLENHFQHREITDAEWNFISRSPTIDAVSKAFELVGRNIFVKKGREQYMKEVTVTSLNALFYGIPEEILALMPNNDDLAQNSIKDLLDCNERNAESAAQKLHLVAARANADVLIELAKLLPPAPVMVAYAFYEELFKHLDTRADDIVYGLTHRPDGDIALQLALLSLSPEKMALVADYSQLNLHPVYSTIQNLSYEKYGDIDQIWLLVTKSRLAKVKMTANEVVELCSKVINGSFDTEQNANTQAKAAANAAQELTKAIELAPVSDDTRQAIEAAQSAIEDAKNAEHDALDAAISVHDTTSDADKAIRDARMAAEKSESEYEVQRAYKAALQETVLVEVAIENAQKAAEAARQAIERAKAAKELVVSLTPAATAADWGFRSLTKLIW